MTRQLLTTILITLCALTAYADILPQLRRQKPDMEAIRQAVTDRTSPYYFPRLMEEFQRNDTLMKIDKYRHLYLGYMFQEDYTPYRSVDTPIRFVPTSGNSRLSKAECDSVIKYAKTALADNPFNLREMVLLINALREKGNNGLADIWQYKLNYLLMAIVSTGTGKDKENAWYVTELQHEYVLLNMMDLIVDDHSFYEPCYEYITVHDRDGINRGGYYFNIGTLLDEYYRKHPDESESETDHEL